MSEATRDGTDPPAPVTIDIVQERPDSPDARGLIEELEAELEPQYPSESRHGYSVDKLLSQGVAFFVIRVDSMPAGCGGIQLYGTEYGELKRMYVRPAWRGHGLARRMVNRLAEHARAHGVPILRLETGIHQEAAIRLYEGMGFRRRGPFGEYVDDPLSRYFERPA